MFNYFYLETWWFNQLKWLNHQTSQLKSVLRDFGAAWYLTTWKSFQMVLLYLSHDFVSYKNIYIGRKTVIVIELIWIFWAPSVILAASSVGLAQACRLVLPLMGKIQQNQRLIKGHHSHTLWLTVTNPPEMGQKHSKARYFRSFRKIRDKLKTHSVVGIQY